MAKMNRQKLIRDLEQVIKNQFEDVLREWRDKLTEIADHNTACGPSTKAFGDDLERLLTTVREGNLDERPHEFFKKYSGHYLPDHQWPQKFPKKPDIGDEKFMYETKALLRFLERVEDETVTTTMLHESGFRNLRAYFEGRV